MKLKFKAFDPDTVVIHCSASPPHRDVDAAEITRWHRARGFRTIGYHYVIKRDGTLETGRPISQQGAHARGHNHYTIGICLVGGVDKQGKAEDNFTDAQRHTLYRTVTSVVYDYKITSVIGHHDIPGVNKACPSFNVTEWLSNSILAKAIYYNSL